MTSPLSTFSRSSNAFRHSVAREPGRARLHCARRPAVRAGLDRPAPVLRTATAHRRFPRCRGAADPGLPSEHRPYVERRARRARRPCAALRGRRAVRQSRRGTGRSRLSVPAAERRRFSRSEIVDRRADGGGRNDERGRCTSHLRDDRSDPARSGARRVDGARAGASTRLSAESGRGTPNRHPLPERRTQRRRRAPDRLFPRRRAGHRLREPHRG